MVDDLFIYFDLRQIKIINNGSASAKLPSAQTQTSADLLAQKYILKMQSLRVFSKKIVMHVDGNGNRLIANEWAAYFLKNQNNE